MKTQMVAPYTYQDDIAETMGSAFETNNDVELSLTCVNQQPPFQ